MNKLIVVIITIHFSLFSIQCISQSCLPQGITFSTQAQIDSFPINYPNCTVIEGHVLIAGSDITNLNGLNALTSIWGNLLIGRYFEYSDTCNPVLSSLAGLGNVTSVGGDLSIDCNYVLTTLVGLESLTSIGGTIQIRSNDSLSSLVGLDNITSMERLWIESNNSLTSLEGLDNLNSVAAGLIIAYNDGLTSLSGLDSVTTVGWILSIYSNNALTSLAELHKIDSLGGLLNIQHNDALTSLAGLDNITSVEGLWIESNDALTSLEGLDNLKSVGGNITIKHNDGLTSLAGIDYIDANTISSLYIFGNDLLSTCDVQSICEYLVAPNGTVDIHDNATGCNSQDEVEESCEIVSVGEVSLSDKITIHPNPFFSSTIIEFEIERADNVKITVHNQYGLLIESIYMGNLQPGKNKHIWDASGLSNGIYFIQIKTGLEITNRKVIKVK